MDNFEFIKSQLENPERNKLGGVVLTCPYCWKRNNEGSHFCCDNMRSDVISILCPEEDDCQTSQNN